MSRNDRIHLLLATALAVGAWTGARAESEAPEPARMPETQQTEMQPAGTPETQPAAVPSPPAPMPVGNVADGKVAYDVCAVCHLENGAGRPDGIFPQLAGQHASVTYRQIADTRDGRRTNPIMCPFAATLTDSQVLADLASYIESLPLPLDNGKGPGIDYAMGAELYARDCADCHGDRGQGNAERLMPMIASQHFAYVARQIDDISGRHRENADPRMVGVAWTYSQREREAVADFISRLEEAQQLVPNPEAVPE
ncbi:MAG: c-type cytochrome [Deltaproteobacteria bacterium]|nr:c-type cytochrome [Deltaproteobacteria bacterium]MBW2397694.1 c-type cytochrome [Deltaproteobacteria bacterium]